MAGQRHTNPKSETPFSPTALGPYTAFALSSKLTAETMRFWAKRTHAYGEFLETLAGAADAGQMLEAEMNFIRRAQDDYKASAQAASQLMRASAREAADGADLKPQGSA